MRLHMPGSTYRVLSEMVDAAISGTFVEGDYDETELSCLEAKWKQYLTGSVQAREQIEKEREVLRGLIADISHQTRTPLSNIKLYTELLREEDLPEHARVLAESLWGQAERLEFLIQSLITMSRLETGVIQVHPQKNQVLPMLEYVAEQMQEKALKKRTKIRLENRAGLSIEACFDPKWTSEALCNVVDNGIKYSPERSVLRIRAEEYEMFVRISVEGAGSDFPSFLPKSKGTGRRRAWPGTVSDPGDPDPGRRIYQSCCRTGRRKYFPDIFVKIDRFI